MVYYFLIHSKISQLILEKKHTIAINMRFYNENVAEGSEPRMILTEIFKYHFYKLVEVVMVENIVPIQFIILVKYYILNFIYILLSKQRSGIIFFRYLYCLHMEKVSYEILDLKYCFRKRLQMFII